MSSESSDGLNVKIELPAEWAARRVLGPVLSEIGEDFKKLYVIGRDKIINAAHRKIDNPNDGKSANLRVARDVFWNGAFTDSDICAEYFGGILASSRSEDGKNDDAIQFLETIRSMSSTQLKFHYLIYSCLNKMFLQSGVAPNVALGHEFQTKTAYFSWIELSQSFQIEANTVLNILYRGGLLHEYKLNYDSANGDNLAYIMVRPTTFGVFLYAAAHNQLLEWQNFGSQDFGEFPDVELPKFFAPTLEELRKIMKVR